MRVKFALYKNLTELSETGWSLFQTVALDDPHKRFNISPYDWNYDILIV